MSEQVVPENSNSIRIQPRELPKKKGKRKRASKKPKESIPEVLPPPPPPQPAFDSNVERAVFLLKKRRTRKKAFFKEAGTATAKPAEAKAKDPHASAADEPEGEIGEEKKEEIRKTAGPVKSEVLRGEVSLFFYEKRTWIFYGLGLLATGIVCALTFYPFGIVAGLREAEEAATKKYVGFSPQVAATVDLAIQDLRYGDPRKALASLLDLEKLNPDYASLTYLSALAALQSGDLQLAQRKSEESIAKHERVSDALGIQAVVQMNASASSSRTHFSNGKLDAENLMRKAIIADTANPFPHIELANLLRNLGRKEEAMQEIKAAQVRLNPMDSHLVMDVTLALMAAEDQPGDKMKLLAEKTNDVRKLFPAAVIAMRLGDFAHAAEYLRICRQELPPEVFDYLVNDPTLRRYAYESKLAEFYPDVAR